MIDLEKYTDLERTVTFKNGKREVVPAYSEATAIILAQARMIEKCYDYSVDKIEVED
jgi:hypothetical protein